MCLKEEMAWATDMHPHVISNTCVILKNKAVCMHCYVVLSNVWDSNYFKQGSVTIILYLFEV